MSELSSGLSPWKKPRAVVLTKSKSLKRKSKSFSLELDSESTPKSSLITNSNPLSTIIENKNLSTNIFSVPKSVLNDKNENDDMRFFFKGSNSEASCVNSIANDTDISEVALNRTAHYLSQFQTNIIPEKINEKPVLFESNFIPIDWSLKTRLRFSSKSQFKCCNNLKSIHESQAIFNFSKLTEFYNNLENSNTRSDAEDIYKTLFCESILYWMFPCLPWLKLYPRSLNLNLANTSCLPSDAQNILWVNWTVSFKSLYNSLKCNECPYFYVIFNTFMILFRTENINGISDIHAIVTPTTKGMRKTFKDEGILFTMPLIKNSSSNFDSSPNKNDESSKENINEDILNNKNSCESINTNDEKKVEEEEECETNEWLEQIGLTSNLKIQNSRSNNRQDNSDSIDNKPQSTLLVQGGDVQALFNFLLNSKIFNTTTGPMSGIPPTLLSHQCFVGATMQKLKTQQAVVKNLSPTGESITLHTIDINGPILPIHIHRLCNLFKRSQNGAFDLTANALDNSQAFNCTTPESNEIKYNGHNLDSSEKKSMNLNLGIKGSTATINSIVLVNESFKCY